MKEIMKQTEKTEKKKHLTDAELQQVTGGSLLDKEAEYCKAQSDKESCVERDYCEWGVDKDGHYHCALSL